MAGAYTPTGKVSAAGIGGAVVVIVVWALSLFHIDVPTVVSAALTLVASFGAGYLTPAATPPAE